MLAVDLVNLIDVARSCGLPRNLLAFGQFMTVKRLINRDDNLAKAIGLLIFIHAGHGTVRQAEETGV